MSTMKWTDEQILEAFNKVRTINGTWRALGHTSEAASGFRRRCRKLIRRASTLGPTDAPISPVVPDGYRLHSVTTRTDRNGAMVGQSISARIAPDGDAVHSVVPDGHSVAGVSSYLGPDGSVQGQWVKTRANDESLRSVLDALPALLDPLELRGAVAPTPAPATTGAESLAVYVIGDAHIGMYAWHEETGEDWDLSIAERVMRGAIDGLVESMPACEEALLVNVGDLLHFNDQTNRTPGHGHQLDVDGRFSKVMRSALRILRYYVDRVLEKHAKATLYMVRGNHDPELTLAVAMALDLLYEREPRVTIDTSPAWYKYHRFGANLIGLAHGDGCKLEKLPELMAAERAFDWGQTRHRIWLTGHVHHRTTEERAGCTVHTFRTLAAKDSWHSRNAYRSGRDMQAILLHREHGEKRRVTETLEMIMEREAS